MQRPETWSAVVVYAVAMLEEFVVRDVEQSMDSAIARHFLAAGQPANGQIS